jgi:hypothetical protein
MKRLIRRAPLLIALLGLTVLASSACGTTVQTTGAPAAAEPVANALVTAAPLADRAALHAVAHPTTAPELRVAYNEVLDEHALLAMIATSASLGHRSAELAAASAQLQTNADQLADLVSQIYDPKTGNAFSTFWRLHIGYFLEYTDALGRGDHATASRAGADLEKYAADLENLLKSSTESMPVGVVRALVTKHVHNVDHQHAGNWQAAYGDILPAIDNMRVISDHLTLGVQVKYGDRYTGDTTAASSKLGTTVASALQVNVALFGIAGGAAIDQRDAEAGLAVNTARENIRRLAAVLGNGTADPAVDHALSQLVDDLDASSRGAKVPTPSSNEAAVRLDGQAAAIVTALTARYPKLAGSNLEALLRTYIAGIQKTVVAQAAGDWPAAFATMSNNEAHGTQIADVIAAATA